jgi:hypothetical protein
LRRCRNLYQGTLRTSRTIYLIVIPWVPHPKDLLHLHLHLHLLNVGPISHHGTKLTTAALVARSRRFLRTSSESASAETMVRTYEIVRAALIPVEQNLGLQGQRSDGEFVLIQVTV